MPKITPTIDIFNKSKKLTIFEINTLQTVTFVYSCLNNITPPPFNTYYLPSTLVHHHKTRRAQDIHCRQVSKTVNMFAIKARGTKLWNSLPDCLRHVCNIDIFKSNCKTYLMNDPNRNC